MDQPLIARCFRCLIFSSPLSAERATLVCFPPEDQPSSLPHCLSRRRLVGLRFLVARQLRVRFRLPVSTRPQVALAAPPVDAPDRQVD